VAVTGVGRAEELVVPGSGNPEYMLGRLAQEFNRRQGEYQVTLPASTGTAGAVRDVGSGAASLGRVGRPLTDQELRGGLRFVPLGRDSVVFVGGAAVTLGGISSAQAVAAYQGLVTDWGELGGGGGPIRAIGREPTDASRRAIMRHIGAFEKIVFGDQVKLVHLDPEMVELLDRFPTSLGFLNRSALFACKTRVVLLSLDGVESTPENMNAGRYPLFLELGLIYKGSHMTPAAQAFVTFIQSPSGAALLRAYGVIPSFGGL